MPGYQLVETRCLRPHKYNGIEPNDARIGVLDFLREIAQEPFPFPKFHAIQLTGLEEVLFAARPQQAEIALKIHRLLKHAAQDLEKKLLKVQIVFRGKIIRGETLWVEYRHIKLPIGHIFGCPIQQTDSHGNPYYNVNFALSH